MNSGDTLRSSVRPGLTELINRQIEPLSRQLQSTITSIDSIFTGASNVLNVKTQENIKESIEVLTSAINAVNNSATIIENTLTEKRSIINNTLDNIESITTNFAEVSNEFNNFPLNDILSNLENSLDGINSLVNNINSDNSSFGRLINSDEVYINLNSSIENLNLLINDIKTNPKKYVHFSIFGRK